MAPDDSSGARPAPVVLRIKLRYDDVESMIQRFAVNVGKTGLFLPTKSLQPIGSEIKFELRLQTDQPVLVGLGRVKAAREPDPENPKATFGIAVELMRVTRESRDLILKMLERRRQLGLPETGLPMPADIDAARRSDLVETGVSAVPQFVPALDSSPLAPSERTSDALMTSPRRQTGPIAVAKIAAVEPLPPEAPRKKRVPVAELIASASGPIVTAAANIDGLLDEQVDVGAALARARALAGGDLDGELEALLDVSAAPMEIGIEAASAELARQLGGAAVRRDRSARWAPPPPTASEPDVAGEVASNGERAAEAKGEGAGEVEAKNERASRDVEAKNARASGDVEAKNDPAQTNVPVPDLVAPDLVAPGPAATEIAAKPASDIVAPEPAATEIVAPEPAATDIDDHRATGYVREEPDARDDVRADDVRADDIRAPEPADTMFDARADEATPVSAVEPEVPTQDDDEAPLFERPARYKLRAQARMPTGQLIHDEADASQFEDAHEVEAAQIHDEIHRLDEGDFEEVEHTQIGEPIDPEAYEQQAARLDAELDEAEREDLGFSETMDAGMAGLDPGQSSGGFALQEAQPGDYFMPLGEQPTAYGEPQPIGEEIEEEIEEIDDFEILAEADAEDEDLMAASAEQEVSARHPLIADDPHEAPTRQPDFELPPARPSFLNRLELDEDSGYHTPPAEPQYDDFSHSHGEIDPRVLSAGHALRAFEEPEDFNAAGAFTPVPSDPYARPVGEQSYTFAGDIPEVDFDAPHGNYAAEPPSGFIPPDAFDQSDVIAIGPSPLEQHQAAEDFPDLESALEALDVDLDDLGRPVPAGRRRANRPDSLASAPTEHAPTARKGKPGRAATPAPAPSGRVHKRATTEDGILIDFDDDDQ